MSVNDTEVQNADIVKEICYSYIGPILCVFGVLGNIINLIVLSRQQLIESPYVYLKAIAVTDMFALLVSFPYMVFSRHSKEYSWKWYEAYIFLPLVNFFTASSIWITVVMTIDRFIFVKFPIWARWRCNRFNAKVRVWIILAATVVISVPRLFCYEVQSLNEYSTNSTLEAVYKMGSTPFKNSKYYHIMNIVCIILIHFVPLIIMCIINTYLIVAVQQARVAREEMNLRNNRESEWHRDQRRFTVTLISIVLLAIASILPAAIYDLLRQTRSGRNFLQPMLIISNLLMWFNLSMNFILYCAFNKKFVRVLKEVMGRGFYKFRDSLKSVKDQSEMTVI